MTAENLPELRGRRTHRAFHLVVDDTFVNQWRRRIRRALEFNPVTFLSKIHFVQLGEEHRVHINRQQIIEILTVFGSKRIRRPVAAGKGVHKGVQRTPDHHEERIAYRIAFTAAERCMLENMRHPGRIHRESAKRHEEHILVVLRRKMQMCRPCFLVAIFFHIDVQRFDPMTTHLFEGRVYSVFSG